MALAAHQRKCHRQASLRTTTPAKMEWEGIMSEKRRQGGRLARRKPI